MSSQTLILPYRRSSPLHIPRRDLVLSAYDSLALRVTIVESDSDTAMALDLSAGGVVLRLIVSRCYPYTYTYTRHDYGWARCTPDALIWAGRGVISDAIGSFDVFLPLGTMQTWPRSCDWAVQLDFSGGAESALLGHGTLDASRVGRLNTLSWLSVSPPRVGGFWNNGGVLCLTPGPLAPAMPTDPALVGAGATLPTSAPSVGLWNNGGVVCIAPGSYTDSVPAVAGNWWNNGGVVCVV